MVPTTTQAQTNGDLLRRLAAAKGPCITIVVQCGNGEDFERNKKLALQSAARELKNGYSDAGHLLKAIEEADLRPPQGARSLVLFSADGILEQFAASEEIPSSFNVSEGFQLRPLLALQDQSREFYILALSQRHPRLLRCTNSTSEEVPLPAGTPLNLDEYMQTRKPDHTLESMAKGGPSTGSMRGVISGTGADAHDHNDYIEHYFTLLNRAVCEVLKDTDAPLVPVSVEKELADYKRVNTYAHLVEPGVQGAPDGLKGGEMHRRALECLRQRPSDAVVSAMGDFDKLVGTGHGSVHSQDIVKAAYEGRVSHLFLQPNAEYTGAFDETRFKVKRHTDDLDRPHDLLNDAVLETLRHGGSVAVLSAEHMPNGVPVAAVYRYPAPETQTASTPAS